MIIQVIKYIVLGLKMLQTFFKGPTSLRVVYVACVISAMSPMLHPRNELAIIPSSIENE